jgi:hypothetical protein
MHEMMLPVPLADPSLGSCGFKANVRNLLHQMDST